MKPRTASDADTEGRRLYPIRTVAQLTSVNPITLRAWERRYNLIRPIRTPAGHRLYSDEDVRRVREIVELSGQGIGLAQIAVILANRKTPPSRETTSAPSLPRLSSSGETLRKNPINQPEGWHDLMEQAVLEMDGHRLSRVERDALRWLHPHGLFESLFIPTLERLENRSAWSDRELTLSWFGEHLRARLHWLLDAQTVARGSPSVAVDMVGKERPFLSLEYRLLLRLAQQARIRIMPLTLDQQQAQRLIGLWAPTGWLRLTSPTTRPEAWKSLLPQGDTLVLPCQVEASSLAKRRTDASGLPLSGAPDQCHSQIMEKLGI